MKEKPHPYRYVYVLKEEGTDFFKLGVTNNHNKRFSTLQVGNPRKLVLVKSFRFYFTNHAFSFEHSLHREYKKFKAMGEWFKLPKEKLEDLLVWGEREEKVVEQNRPKRLPMYFDPTKKRD